MAVSRAKQETETYDGADEGVDLREQVRLFVDRVREGIGEDGLREVMRQLHEETGTVPEFGNDAEPLHGGGGGEEEHVIDLGGRLRRAWVFPQFRLLVLTAMIGAGAGAAEAGQYTLARVLGPLCLFVFGAWSVAHFRKRGLAQMLMKWLVYGSVLMAGGMLVDSVDADRRPVALVAVLAAALVLTLSKLSEWLGEKIRVHVWESDAVRVVRGWFV